ncbi:hypothetical protein Tco_1469999 [Tanacetum coccineum]
MDVSRLKETNLIEFRVLDAEIQVVDPEIQVMDEAVDDPDVEENLVAVEEMVSDFKIYCTCLIYLDLLHYKNHRIVAPAEKEAGTVATAIKCVIKIGVSRITIDIMDNPALI